jgi:hypothetical protein
MDESTKDAIFERLKHSVRLLPLRLLYSYDCFLLSCAKADELALVFDHWQGAVLHNYGKQLSTDQS